MQKSKDRKVVKIKRRGAKPKAKPAPMLPENMPLEMNIAFAGILDRLNLVEVTLAHMLKDAGVEPDAKKSVVDQVVALVEDLRRQNATYRGMMNASAS